MKTKQFTFSTLPSPRQLLTLLTICLVIAGCSKKDDPAPQTKNELLTQITWKVTSLTSTDPLVQALGLLLVGSEYSFKTDGTFTYTILGLSGGSGTWEFASSESKIIFNKGTPDEASNDIVTLDSSTMELKEVKGTTTTTTKYAKK